MAYVWHRRESSFMQGEEHAVVSILFRCISSVTAAYCRAEVSSGDIQGSQLDEERSESRKEEALRIVDHHFLALSASSGGVESVERDLLPDMVSQFLLLDGEIYICIQGICWHGCYCCTSFAQQDL